MVQQNRTNPTYSSMVFRLPFVESSFVMYGLPATIYICLDIPSCNQHVYFCIIKTLLHRQVYKAHMSFEMDGKAGEVDAVNKKKVQEGYSLPLLINLVNDYHSTPSAWGSTIFFRKEATLSEPSSKFSSRNLDTIIAHLKTEKKTSQSHQKQYRTC